MQATGQPLSIEYLRTSALVAYARNARTHSQEQVDQIAASIDSFGFANPILVDAGGVIIAGHGRLLAAEQLCLERVPVVRLGHLTDSQARALRIADNQIALTSGWDLDLLAEEVAALNDEDFDLDLLGFDEEATAALLSSGANATPLDLGDIENADEHGVAHRCPRCGHEW